MSPAYIRHAIGFGEFILIPLHEQEFLVKEGGEKVPSP